MTVHGMEGVSGTQPKALCTPPQGSVGDTGCWVRLVDPGALVVL